DYYCGLYRSGITYIF
nr:immunoglobulin light chain junction region [Macaca mulatta]